MLSRLLTGIVLSLMFVNGAQAAPDISAPLPQDVIDKLLREPHQQPIDGLATELAQRLDETEDILQRWEKELTGAPGAREGVTVDRPTQLQAQAAMLSMLKEQAVNRFSGDGDHNKPAKKKPGATRAERLAQGFVQLDASIKVLLAAAKPADRARAMAQTQTVLQQMRGKIRDREQAPSAMIWPTQREGGMAGATSPREKSSIMPRYLSEQQNRYMNSVASNGTIVLAAVPATPGEAGQCYAGGVIDNADLAATPDAQKDDAEIQALAEKLGYSPARILAWVHDNIKFEPYWGSLKGAKGALVSGAGNATDQASLMIALLRASNIPARYVSGRVQITDPVATQPGGRALRWLGAKTYRAAAIILNKGGIPAAADPALPGVQLDHIWVQACVPYSHYRGAAVSNAGHRWIPLDAAFKDKAFRQDIDVGISFNYGFSAGNYLAARTDVLPHEYYARRIEAALPVNKDMTDLSPEGVIKTLKLDILPASSPYSVIGFINLSGATTPEPSVLPAAHRYALDVTLKTSTGTVLLSRSVSYPDASLKRLSLSFTPSDSPSQIWWNSWNGSFASLPTSGVNVSPVLKLEGVNVAGGAPGATALTGSNLLTLILKLRLPDSNLGTSCIGDNGSGNDPDTTCSNKTVYTNIKPGAYHALQAYAFQGSDRYIKERSAQLVNAVRSNPAPTPANPATYEATLGEFLHVALVKYLRYGQDATRQIGEQMNVAGWRGNDIGLTTVDLKTEYLMDQPFALKTGGLLIDVAGGQARLVKLNTTSTDGATLTNETWPTFKLALYAGSAYEHYIWQEMARSDAVSTVRGLQFANETGIPIRIFNTLNIGNYDSLMTLSGAGSMAAYKTEITNQVNSGATVTVPNRAIAYVAEGTSSIWNGAVYIAENKAEGYMLAAIAGGFGGGWGAPMSTPINFSYLYNPTTPAIYTLPNISSFSFLNDTTAARGSNSFQTMSGDPVNMVTGNFYHVERDLAIPGRGGLPLVFERSYNSAKPANGTLGWGWTHSFNHSLRFYGIETGQAKVSWIDGTGGEKFFATTSHVSGNISANVPLLNSPGIYVVFKRETGGQYTIREKNGLSYTFESVNGGTTDTGLKAKLLSIKDRNNNTLTLAYNADTTLKDVTDGVGRKLAFTYTDSRITRLDFKSAGGSIERSHEYTYDGAGNLTAHKSPATLIDPIKSPPVTYQYYTSADGANLDHAMKQYLLPRGNGMKFHYYADGRVFKHAAFGPAGELLGQEMSFTYNSFRRETVQVNERGFTRRFLFDERGNLVNLTEENGAYRSYVYDPVNPSNRTKKTDPYGMVSQYAYDALGNVTQITQPDDTTVQYLDFNTFNQPRRIKDARGNYSLLKYDAVGNLTDSVTLKAGVVPFADTTPAASDILAWSKHQYDAYGNRTAVKALKTFVAALGDFSSGTGPVVTTAYDAASLYPISLTRNGDKSGDGLADAPDVETVAYDAQGREIRGIDASWQVVQREFDPVDRVKRATDSLGYWRDAQFDANGNPINESLAVGTVLADSNSAQYDGADRQTQSINAGGHVTRQEFDPRGNPLIITDPDGYSLGFEYDAMDRWVVAYDREGNSVTRSLDISGRERAITDPNGITVTRTWWDKTRNGRQKEDIDAQGRKTAYDYDANGNLTVVTDNAGQSSRIFYDALNRPVRAVGPLIVADNVYPVTCTQYDPLGNPAGVWAGSTLDLSATTCDFADPSLKQQIAYDYNDFGWQVKQTDPLGKVTTQSHDRFGNVVTSTDAKAQQTQLTWAYGHQLKTRTVKTPDGSVYTTDTLTRNPLGQLLTVTRSNPAISQTLAYDPAHRLIHSSESRNGAQAKTLTYAWSPGGLLNMMQDSDANRTDYLWDNTGRLTGIWAPNFDYLAFSHDAGGRLTEKWYPNGATARYSYNNDGSLASLTNRSAAQVILSSHTYAYDTLARRTHHSEQIGSLGTRYNKYIYDALSRLTQTQTCTSSSYATCTADETSTYDIWDNRKTKTTPSGTVAYVHDVAHQLKEMRQTNASGALLASYVYDANGNQISRPGQTLTWNPDNQLAGIGVESYQYDAAGRRIRKTSGATTTSWLYDGDGIHAEWNGASLSGKPTAVTVQGGLDQPLMRLTGSTTDPTAAVSLYHQDGLGSVVGQTSASGSVQGLQRFDAWGNKTQSTGSVAQYGYTGREPDATGLVYYRARYYDPATGRFISRDPAGMPDGVNRYSYVNNDPVNNTDPSGEICVPCAFATGGALVNVAIQGVQDYRAGKLSSAGTYLGAAVSGAAGGLALLSGGGVAATVAYGSGGALLGNGVQQGIDLATGAQQGGPSARSAITATLAGGVAAGVLKPFAGVIKPGYASTAQGLMTKYANGTISNVANKTATKMVPSIMLRDNTVPEGLLSDALKNGADQIRSTPANGSGNAYSSSNSGSQSMQSFAQMSAPQDTGSLWGTSLNSSNYSSGGFSIFRSK